MNETNAKTEIPEVILWGLAVGLIGGMIGLSGMAVSSIWEAWTIWRVAASVASVSGIIFAVCFVIGLAVA